MPNTSSRGTANVERELSACIDKFEPEMVDRIRACRAAMRQRLPTAVELVYDNYNFFVIGYGPSERTSEAPFSLAADRSGVTLCFLRGSALDDPDGLLRGEGKLNRTIRLPNAAALGEPAVERLVAAALAQEPVPMPSSGDGYTVMKSISARQRPRR